MQNRHAYRLLCSYESLVFNKFEVITLLYFLEFLSLMSFFFAHERIKYQGTHKGHPYF